MEPSLFLLPPTAHLGLEGLMGGGHTVRDHSSLIKRSFYWLEEETWTAEGEGNLLARSAIIAR